MSTVAEILKSDELTERFDQVAPTWMQYPAEYGFAIQHLKANDYLMKVAGNNPNSLMAAMSNVAACGLSLNPAKKEAYLVPRKGNICLDPSYMGLVKLATDTGSIVWAQAKLVHEKDNYEVHGVDERPTHSHSPFGDRGPIIGVYCVAKTKDGAYLTESMAISDVHAIRDRSEAYKKNPQRTPWYSDEGEMIKKTVVKRASKMWPRSDSHEAERRLAAAVQTSHDNEEVVLTTSAPSINEYSQDQKEFYDQLIETNNEIGMFVFQQTNEPGINASLYNSFEKGTVTKFKRVVDELYSKGASMFEDYLNRFRELESAGDTDGIQELEAELETSELDLIKERI